MSILKIKLIFQQSVLKKKYMDIISKSKMDLTS